MEVTEVQIYLPSESERAEHCRLLAYATIILDSEFRIHDMKVIGGDGRIFVSFPSKPRRIRCAKCMAHSVVRGKGQSCSRCGELLPLPADRVKTTSDVVHPITSACRQKIEKAVIDEYERVRRDHDDS